MPRHSFDELDGMLAAQDTGMPTPASLVDDADGYVDQDPRNFGAGGKAKGGGAALAKRKNAKTGVNRNTERLKKARREVERAALPFV